MSSVDVNADVGEGGDDPRLFPHLTSVSIACGGHAGDEGTMRRTITAASAAGLRLGAHPGYTDRVNFGRAGVELDAGSLRLAVFVQLATIARVAAECGARLTHVKAHGALYNRAWHDREVADVIARATADLLPGARLLCPPGSAQAAAAEAAGLVPLHEVFADRAYLADGSGLVPRSHPGAVITDPAQLAAQLRAIPHPEYETICVHGDNPAAEHLLRALSAALGTVGRIPAPYPSSR